MARNPIRRGSARAHSALVKACLDYLALEAIPAVPITTTGVPVSVLNGWARLKANPAQVGMADVIGCLPPDGRLLWLECKTGGAVQTREQAARADQFARSGALVIVAGSWEDVRDALTPYLSRPRVVPMRARA